MLAPKARVADIHNVYGEDGRCQWGDKWLSDKANHFLTKSISGGAEALAAQSGKLKREGGAGISPLSQNLGGYDLAWLVRHRSITDFRQCLCILLCLVPLLGGGTVTYQSVPAGERE